VKAGTVVIKYIPTLDMVADGLTKSLIGVKFQKFFDMLGLTSIPDVNVKNSG
jgi:hypothetical protein